MRRTLAKFGLPFEKATPLVHFPKALKRPRNNAGPASEQYFNNDAICAVSTNLSKSHYVHTHTHTHARAHTHKAINIVVLAGPALFRARLRAFGKCTNGVAFSKGGPNLASVRLTL